MFEFYIDGTKYDNPANWNEFTEIIEYDQTFRVFSFKYPTSLTFSGAAYNYLYSIRGVQGICYSAVLMIKQRCNETAQFKPIFTGTIYVSDCKFQITRCQVECAIIDNNYTALIFNNKSTKVKNIDPQYFPTKNGLSSTSIPANGIPGEWLVVPELFNPAGGAVIASPSGIPYGVFLFDAFDAIVHWLSDNKVHFKSTMLNYFTERLDASNLSKYLMVTSGEFIRYDNNDLAYNFSYSFEDLFNGLNKLYPCAIGIEYETDGTPIIRIEPLSYFKQNSVSITINNIRDVEEKTDTNLLFSSIDIGRATIDGTYIPLPLRTFDEQIYYVTGQCNVDNKKDLTAQIILDTNIIEAVATVTASRDYDFDLFFIEAEYIDTGMLHFSRALKTVNYDNPSNYHYNENLMNQNIIDRNNFVNDVNYIYTDSFGVSSMLTASSQIGFSYLANNISFERPIDNASYEAMKDNLPLAIQYNVDGATNKKAWIKKTTRKLSTGEMKFELISNITNIQ